ncbi:MAG: RNA polymerase sigma factor [Gemmatimonadaceae bacterium]|nr:RNA polymerase sigma factor [Gemmatimonadaceae bacterium]
MTPETSALVGAARRGDRAAFAVLVERYYPRALRFASRMLGDPLDAEEAVQDAWVRVHGALPRFVDGAAFEPWFFRILANRCRTSSGKRARYVTVVVTADVVPDSAAPVAPDDSWRDEVQRALAQLPAEQREAFLLRHVEDLSYEEIAEATGIGLSAARMRVKRACDALRLQLTETAAND